MKTVTEQQVYLLGGSNFNVEETAQEFAENFDANYTTKGSATDAALLVEFAARASYQDWQPKVTTSEYIENTIKQEHGFILGHANATIGIVTSRAVSREFLRHTEFQFSEASQRFVEPIDQVYIPYLLRDFEVDTIIISTQMAVTWSNYGVAERYLLKQGVSEKQARETCRFLLPEAAMTFLIMTGSIMEWRKLIIQRSQPALIPDVRIVAYKIYTVLNDMFPEFFPDFIIEKDDKFGLEYIRKV